MIFYQLQRMRLAIFWTKDMQRKENVNPFMRWVGKQILRMQGIK